MSSEFHIGIAPFKFGSVRSTSPQTNTYKKKTYHILYCLVLSYNFKKKHILSLFCHSKTSRRLLYVSENGFSHSMASSMINKRIKDGIWWGFPQISPGHWEDWAGRLNVIIKSQAQQAVPWGGTQRCVKLEDLPVPPIYGNIHGESEDRVIDFGKHVFEWWSQIIRPYFLICN